VTVGGSAAAVLQRKTTAIVNVARVIAPVQYHFVVAVWRAEQAESETSEVKMDEHSTDKLDIDTERSRIRHAFWLSIFGLAPAAGLTIFLVHHPRTPAKSPEAVVAIVGLFTSVTGTLVGAFFGLQIGQAGAEHERRNRQMAEESRQRAEEVARMALAHLGPDMAKQVLSASQKGP
jgi:hypothetical protein